MISIRHRDERGHANHGWLDTYHTFSFDTYYDTQFMGFRSLRVINEDRVAPGKGFPTHPHRDMEIITYILEGALEHKDSMGTGSIIRPGDAQRMSAGTGITHSEFNASKTEPVHLLQIWILPDVHGIKPSYEQKKLDREKMRGHWLVIASKNPSSDAVTIHQDAKLSAAILEGDQPLKYQLDRQRYAWLQVARGRLQVNRESLDAGDGIAFAEEAAIEVAGKGEALLFDLA
jgi:quercetin 2,3-dioxygenase